MLGRILRNGISRFIACILIAALSVPLGLPFRQTDRAVAAGDALLVVVAGLDNRSGKQITLQDYGIGAVISATTRVKDIEIVPADKVLKVLEGGPEKASAVAAATALGADMALYGKIQSIEFENDRLAIAEVELFLYSSAGDDLLLSRAWGRGSSGEKFGYSGPLSDLADEAVRNAVDNGIEDLFGNLTVYGAVTIVTDEGVYVDLNQREVRVGAELAVLRNYEQIATLKVEQTDSAHSLARVVSGNRADSVREGDRVRVMYRPLPAPVKADQPIKKKKKMNPIIIGVLAIGVIAALAGGKKSSPEPVGPSAGRPPDTTIYYRKSSDGISYVYSTSQFDQNYTPLAPVKIGNLLTSNLAQCYDAACVLTNGACPAACASQMCIVPDTAYEYGLATTPQNSTLPSSWRIAVDTVKLSGVTFPSFSDESNARTTIATCDTTSGEWSFLTGADQEPGTISGLGITGVSAPVTHFTPYVLIVDTRPEPIEPTRVSISSCDDNEIVLAWEQSTDSDFLKYDIQKCTDSAGSSCSTVGTVTTSAELTKVFSNVQNGTEYCYAVQVDSTDGLRDSYLSNVVCGTPPDQGGACIAQDCSDGNCFIELISPANGSTITDTTPSFVFMGNGTADTYILYMENAADTVVFQEAITGEGSSQATPTREIFSDVSYSGDTLEATATYQWYVRGINTTTGASEDSSAYSFTLVPSPEAPGTGVCQPSYIPDVPTQLTPADGSNIAVETPTFQWTSVESAEGYTLTVYNSQFQIVYQKSTTSTQETGYDGDPLKNNEYYFWTVRSHTACAASDESNSFKFTKITTDTAPLPAPEWVNPSEDGKSPITQIDGGSSYIVRLYWRQVNSTNLAGYKVYRCEELSECAGSTSGMSPLAVIFKEQLTAPPPNVSCGSFSESSPGYCDISAVNGKRYYYMITAFDETQQDSEPSVTQTVLLGLIRPTPISPGDVDGQEITSSDPKFIWTAVPGDDIKYLLTVKNEDTGLTVFSGQATVGAALGGEVTFVDENEYSWNVMAMNDLVQSSTSLTYKFTKKPTSTKPDAPLWCDDADATKCAAHPDYYEISYSRNSIKLYWQQVTGTSIKGYNIYRATSEGGLDDEAALIGTAQNYDCGTLNDVICFEDKGDDGSGLPRGSQYFYMIKTVDTGDTESLPSETRNVLNYSLVGASLIYPINNQYVYDSQPTFSWHEELGADSYRIELETTTPGNWSAADLVWVATVQDTSVTFGDDGLPPPQKALENPLNPDTGGKPYHWRICSINENYASGKCEGSVNVFYKNLKSPIPQTPVGIRISTNAPTFQWTASPGAAGYSMQLYVYVSGSPIMLFSGDVGNVTTFQVPDVEFQDNTTYYWKVRSYDDYGAVSGQWTNVTEASFEKRAIEAPTLVTPADGSILNPDPMCGLTTDVYGNPTYNYLITFTWNPVQTDAGYIIKVEEEVDAPSSQYVIIWQQEVSGETTTNPNSSCGGEGEIKFSPGRKYRWNVTTGDTEFDVSNSRYFYTGLPAPNLVQPYSGKQVIIADGCDGANGKICVHFEWAEVYGAGLYEIEIARTTSGSQAKEYYFCDPGASALPAASSTVTTTSCDMSTPDADNDNLFTWRVRARDSLDQPIVGGNPGPWSPFWSFTIKISEPVLASPPNSDTGEDGCEAVGPSGDMTSVLQACTYVTCIDQLFVWSPHPQATGGGCYKIQVSDTKDFRNIIFEDHNINGTYNSCADDECSNHSCCKVPSGANHIPMVNGVLYFWRVGASVIDVDTNSCGVSWVYSDPFVFLKRPPGISSLTSSDLDYNTVTLNWTAPKNCDSTEPAISYPGVPPDTGGLGAYLIYQEANTPSAGQFPQNMIAAVAPSQTSVTVSNLSEQTDYYFCVVVRDNSGFMNFAGSLSDYMCLFVHTPAAPDTGG